MFWCYSVVVSSGERRMLDVRANAHSNVQSHAISVCVAPSEVSLVHHVIPHVWCMLQFYYYIITLL